MEIVKPPSEFKRQVRFWFAAVVAVACVVAGFFVALSFIGRPPQAPAPVARKAFPRRAPAEPAAPAPASPQPEETMVETPPPSTMPPIVPAARPAPAAETKTPAPAKHLVLTRPLVDLTSSRRKVLFPPQTGVQTAGPVAPAAQTVEPAPPAAPQESPQPRAAAATAAVGYGATSRDQIMGQAAGPVYNLKARSRKAAGPAPR